MSIELFEHNRIAYEKAAEMLSKTGKVAIIHPTGTGKSFIAFQFVLDNPNKRFCWLSPSENIFNTQIETLILAGGNVVPENLYFFTYTKLVMMKPEELEEIAPDFIILDEFHRCGAKIWGMGVRRLLDMYSEAPILGLTATNIRYLDNQRDMADELFEGNVASYINLGEALVRRADVITVFDTPMIMIRTGGLSRVEKFLKRGMDIVLCAIALVVATTLMIAVAIAIKLEDGGPVFYRQERVTIGGKNSICSHSF